MDTKELLLYLRQAQLQCELIMQSGQQLDNAIKQLQDWSEDLSCQRRACEDMYHAVHFIMIHCYQLSRLFWPAKCCGEVGLDNCHRAMTLRTEINMPDLQHPLRNEALWRHAEALDYSVSEANSLQRFKQHHVTSVNHLITWMDSEAMLSWFDPVTRTFVFHNEEFALTELLTSVKQLQQDILHYLHNQH